MKHLLILLFMSTLVSCGIKNKFLNSSSGSLVYPNNQQKKTLHPSRWFHKQNQSENITIQSNRDVTDTHDAVDDSFFKWYYSLPFIGLAILAFLVYRLKKQNLNSL